MTKGNDGVVASLKSKRNGDERALKKTLNKQVSRSRLLVPSKRLLRSGTAR